MSSDVPSPRPAHPTDHHPTQRPTDHDRAPAAPAPARTTGLLPSFLIALGAMVMVSLVGFLLRDSSLDFPVTHAFNELHVGAFAAFTTTLYFLLDPPGAVALTVLITIVLLIYGLARRRGVMALRTALVYALTVAITWLPVAVYKPLLSRPRPDLSALAHPFSEAQGDGSFPSGHTAFATVSVVALTLIVATTVTTRRVTVILGACWIAFVILMVLSNGVHFPTDALASVLWGLGVTPFIVKLLMWATSHIGRAHL